MSLLLMPDEILEDTIENVIPEGLENLALTCNKIYGICAPFLSQHNLRRSHFYNSTYYMDLSNDGWEIRTAFDLIARIAVEPIIGRYIHIANFSKDSFFMVPPSLPSDPDLRPNFQIHSQLNDIACFHDLLASSPYLTAAGLDWKEYWIAIDADLGSRSYSQHAAAFLLTLLPNTKILSIPRNWMAFEATDRLIHTIIGKAGQLRLPADKSSLAQLTSLRIVHESGWRFRMELALVTPFLALPSIRSFHGISCVATTPSCFSAHDQTTISRELYYSTFRSETMEVVHLEAGCIDAASIAAFLAHMPSLRSLRYSHCTKYETPRGWDICAFISAICAAVGPHLEELSISIHELRGSMAPGTVSMRHLQRLRKLEFPLNVAVCSLTHSETSIADSMKDPSLHDVKVDLLTELVPPTVTHLSIISSGIDTHVPALESMFRDFAARKEQTVPDLEEIHLSSPKDPTASDRYMGIYEKVKEQCEKADVSCILKESETWPIITWLDL